MFRFIKNVSITTFILFASWVFVMAIFAPNSADAIIFTAPPRTIQTGDVTSATILDGTITGADISSSASTTMFRLQVSDLSATSTNSISTFAGGLTIETSGFVYDYSTNNVGIGTGGPLAPLHINATQASSRGQLSISSPINNTYMTWYEGSTYQAYIQYSGGNFIIQNYTNGSYGNLVLNSAGGNVGIGETAPGSKLSVSGGATIGTNYDTTTAPSNGMIIEGNVGIGTTSPFTKLAIIGTITTDNINATSTTATSTFSGGVKLNKAGTGIEFQNGSIQSTAASTPAGSIIAYASTTAPTGWLLADGTSYATASYPLLFDAIGYGYGGSGANFNVPNLQNRQITMASTTANIGQTGGEANHTLTTAEMPAHTHSVTRGSGNGTNAEIDDTDGGVQRSTTSGSTGGGGAHNVLDPYIVLNYIIKY